MSEYYAEISKSLEKYGYCHIDLRHFEEGMEQKFNCTLVKGAVFNTLISPKYKKEWDKRTAENAVKRKKNKPF